MDIVFGKICIFHVSLLHSFSSLLPLPRPVGWLVMYDLSWCWRSTRERKLSSIVRVRDDQASRGKRCECPRTGQQSYAETKLMLMRRSVRGIAALHEVLEGQTHLRIRFVNQREHIVVIVVTVVGGILLVDHVGFQERVLLLG